MGCWEWRGLELGVNTAFTVPRCLALSCCMWWMLFVHFLCRYRSTTAFSDAAARIGLHLSVGGSFGGMNCWSIITLGPRNDTPETEHRPLCDEKETPHFSLMENWTSRNNWNFSRVLHSFRTELLLPCLFYAGYLYSTSTRKLQLNSLFLKRSIKACILRGWIWSVLQSENTLTLSSVHKCNSDKHSAKILPFQLHLKRIKHW